MFIIEKKFRFEASHVLPNHDGKCARLHGHSWNGAVVVSGVDLKEEGPEQGMLMDYGRISEVVNPLVEEYLDHHHLNDTTRLKNPTSEELARWIFRQLKDKLPRLQCVRIEETCTSVATYLGNY